jgi:thioesterase domain-containing protein
MVTTFDALGRELQSTWQREIPLAASLAIEVAVCARDELAVRAPLAPNRNLHGTAFAGSLFSVCVLTGWGAAWLALEQRGIEGVIVVSDSRIQYRKAATGDLVCRCRPDLDLVEQRLASLAQSWPREPAARVHDRSGRQARGLVRRRVRRASEEGVARRIGNSTSSTRGVRPTGVRIMVPPLTSRFANRYIERNITA